MDAYDGHESALISKVDCTAEDSKGLCSENGVKGYPTLKYGDPMDLQDYKGGRTFEALKKFSDENLKPMCSPANIDLCGEDEKSEILKLQVMSTAELDAAIAEKDKAIADLEETFKTEADKLRKQYEQMNSDKDTAIDEIRKSGLGLMKSVKASKAKKGSKDEL